MDKELEGIVRQWRKFLIQGRYIDRIPYGSETNLKSIPKRCVSCGVLTGKLHDAILCKMEQCNFCMGVAWDCSCEAQTEIDFTFEGEE